MVMAVVPLALGLVACGSSSSSGSDSSTSKASSSGGADKLSGKVNDKGTKSVTGKTQLEVEMDDFYFNPTYIKASPGQKVKVELNNEGSATHTFTSSALGVDQEVAPGTKKTISVTVPDTAGLTEFHCNFHSSMGMRGAFIVN